MKNLFSRLISGLASPWRGLKFSLRHPKIWPYFVLPLLISSSFLWGSWLLWDHVDDQVLSYLGGGTDGWWSRVLDWFSLLIFAIFAWYSFTMVGMILASPFNDLLAVQVMKIRGLVSEDPPFWEGVRRSVLDTLKLTGLKVVLTVFSLIIPLLFIPVFLFFVGMDHFDYPWSHQTKGFRGRMRCLKRDGLEFGGFSLLFGLAMGIPFLGLLLMPLAVVSATLLVKEDSSLKSSSSPDELSA
jgi:CysZ protein